MVADIFNLQASSAPLFLQVEPVELVELVEADFAPN